VAALQRTFGERRALATLCAVLFLTFLDNTVVSVILANIQNDLHPVISQLQWIVNGYALAFAALMLTCGGIGDIFGRKTVMLAGVAVFCAGSLICALAPNVDTLIAGRAVMGLGAAASEPGTLSVIRHIYTDRADRARALGAWAAVSGVALAFGPIIGGVIVGFTSWRGVFWFNLIFGMLAFLAALVTVPESSDPQGRSIDVAGLLLGIIVLAAATYAVIGGETAGYSTWWIDLLFAVSVVALVSLITVERRVRDPMLRLDYFRRPAFAGANVLAFVTNFGLFAVFFFVALYLEEVASYSGYHIAVQFLAMTVGMVLAAIVAGRWVARAGPRDPTIVGCVLAGTGVILTEVTLSPTVGYADLAWRLGLVGLGFGMTLVTMTTTALAEVPAERSGIAASTVNTSRELGGVFGVAVLGSIANAQLLAALKTKLVALGIPSVYDVLVINAIEKNAIPKHYQSGGNAKIIKQVIQAAYSAFGDGLDISLLIAGALLLVTATVAVVLRRRPSVPAAAES
jgi:EmrB/QacA subfamily drug resistance transporter